MVKKKRPALVPIHTIEIGQHCRAPDDTLYPEVPTRHFILLHRSPGSVRVRTWCVRKGDNEGAAARDDMNISANTMVVVDES